jgi:Kef-type K+ transport system membrane component KefB
VDDLSFGGFFAVAAIAAAAPLLVSLAPRLRIQAVVVEIVLGIVLGPSVLGWVHVDVPVSVLALIGLSFLLFLSGLELDLGAVRGRVGIVLAAYGCSLVLALAGGVLVEVFDNDNQPLFIGIVLASTSLGLVVPVLRDVGETASGFGQLVLAGCSLGEFGAVVALALFYSRNGSHIGVQVALLVGFTFLVAAMALGLSRIEHSPRFLRTLGDLEETSAQFGVRIAIVVLAVFVALSSELGFEAVLGAFVAGALLRLTDPEKRLTHERLRSKLDAIGYGFLIPAFFVASGLRFDATALADRPQSITMVPLLVLLFLIVRGVPSMLYATSYDSTRVAAAGLLQATTLAVPVVAAQLGIELGTIDADTAAAIIVAGLITVMVYPPLSLLLLSRVKLTRATLETELDADLGVDPA